jgi:hypothetical protein
MNGVDLSTMDVEDLCLILLSVSWQKIELGDAGASEFWTFFILRLNPFSGIWELERLRIHVVK